MSAITQQLMSYGASADPFLANVVFLTNFNGTNGSTSYNEYTGKTITSFGGAALTTSTAGPVGIPSSLGLNGTTDYLVVNDSVDFAFGTGDFTMEFWVYPTGSTVNRRIYAQQTQNPTTNALSLRRDASNNLHEFAVSAGTTFMSMVSISTFSLSTWVFVSLTRSGTTFYLHFGGAMQNSTTSATAVPDVAIGPTIGAVKTEALLQEFWSGSLGPIRLTKGVARYGSGNYTPPSNPFPTF